MAKKTSQTKKASKKSSASTNGRSSSNGKSSSQSNGNSNSGSQQESPTLEELFENCLKDIYSAEQQLIEALPKMAEAAYEENLQDAFEHHFQQTQRHAQRLEKIFEKLGIEGGGETCKAMEGLIEEGNETIQKYKKSPGRDSGLIIGAQKIEHYEIAGYGSLCELADVLGHGKIVELLQKTLNEEKETDETLTDIAKSVNDEAYEMIGQEEHETSNA